MALRACCVQLLFLAGVFYADAKGNCARALSASDAQVAEAASDETKAAQTNAVTLSAQVYPVTVDATFPDSTGFEQTPDGTAPQATTAAPLLDSIPAQAKAPQ